MGILLQGLEIDLLSILKGELRNFSCPTRPSYDIRLRKDPGIMTKTKRYTLNDVDLKPLQVYMMFDSTLPTSTGVYAIVNKLNGKFYIGSARASKSKYYLGFNGRFNNYNEGHRNDLLNNVHHCRYLQNAFNKTIKDGFDPNDVYEIWILEFCIPSECIKREQWHLDTYRPTYNCSLHAMGGIESHTLESRMKMSKALTGKKYGPQSPESRKKKSLALMDKNAKDYIGISPSGEIIHFRNAKDFAKDNKLCDSKIALCCNKLRNHHKGWLFFYKGDITNEQIRDSWHKLYKYMAVSPDGIKYYFAVVRQFADRMGLREGAIQSWLSGYRTSRQGWVFTYNTDFVSVEDSEAA